MTPLRVVSFGDLDGEIWGSMLDLGEPVIAFGTPDGVATAADAALTEDQDGSWRLAGASIELGIAPAAGHDPSDDALCHVSGTLSVAGQRRSIDCLGIRSNAADRRLPRLESLRGISGWFESDHGVTLLALRPAGGHGQENDLVAATVFEPEGWTPVDDPRVSTTYLAGEHPARVGLELWIGDGDEQYSRRAAAEAAGNAARLERGGLQLQVTPLRCHTQGLDGAGVYLLAQLQ